MGQGHTGSPPEAPVESEAHAGKRQEEAVQQPWRHCNSPGDTATARLIRPRDKGDLLTKTNRVNTGSQSI